jgi:hypothetical protein
MTRRTPKRDPRQRSGLTLATPRRVRLEVDASPWEVLAPDLRRRAGRPTEAVSLSWSPELDEALVPVRYRSSPVGREHAPAIVAALAAIGLARPALRVLDALCWAHVAVVAYPDGQRVAFGLSETPRSVSHAEVVGFPFARLDGDRVRPWAGVLHGHLDAEVQGAVQFVRPRTITASGAGAGR